MTNDQNVRPSSIDLGRLIRPSLNSVGLISYIAFINAVATGIYNVLHHHVAINLAVIVSAVGAFLTALAKQRVTPITDPRDGNGNPLSTSALSHDPTIAELATWFHERGIEIKFETTPVQSQPPTTSAFQSQISTSQAPSAT